MGWSKDTVISILQDKLTMKNVCKMGLLLDENKRNRVVTSKAVLECMRCNPAKFLQRLLTVDETWIQLWCNVHLRIA
ncbi:hypothetical protein TNCV_1025111 [Trichonephila clavipes]|nr:hypothetical protein TNCV_1025111 [Trichonephila clavipes]